MTHRSRRGPDPLFRESEDSGLVGGPTTAQSDVVRADQEREDRGKEVDDRHHDRSRHDLRGEQTEVPHDPTDFRLFDRHDHSSKLWTSPKTHQQIMMNLSYLSRNVNKKIDPYGVDFILNDLISSNL
ncbi:MAG: hypothetical protein UT32_C0004G0005 [Parcubacteria group bacterium GW2011_GWC2_39_14]|nr:MAG: hypothetical protein UT32_C0004G0005 [Parcubacteria group bacterium GW2011_GWC2_39_14]KKR54849.1 MAG: hypothetical protein UT91_C0008G0005 [Parcubacteria group bacterium GW2011_GWA2_40_23]